MQNPTKSFKFIRFIAAFLAMLLALSAAACAPNSNRADDDLVEISHISAGLTTEFPRRKLVTFHGNDCWTYINDTLVRYDMEKQETAFTMPMVLDSLAYEQCIDLDSATGHIYLIRTEMDESTQDAAAQERKMFLLELDQNGTEVQRWPLALGWNNFIHALVVIGDRAFTWSYEDSRVREIDLSTGQARLLELPPVNDLAKCGDGLVLLMADDYGGFSRVGVYAPETETLVKDFIADFDTYSATLRLVNTDGNLVYAVAGSAGGGSIHRIDLETEKAELLFMPPTALGIGSIGGGVDGEKLHVLMSDGQIDSYANLDGSWDFRNFLRVMTPYPDMFMTMLPAMARNQLGNNEYPGLNIAYTKTGDESQYYANVVKKLMAKDKDFDLFVVRQSDLSVFEKGMFEDLRQYPNIAANFDRMLPGVADFASHDGKIIGYPMIGQIQLHDYSSAQLDAFGIQAPTAILTMKEYEALFDNVNDTFATQKPATGMLPHDLYRSLSTGYFTYEKELTEQDIITFFADAKRMVEKGIVSLNYQEQELFSSQPNNIFSRGQSRMIIPLDRADDPYSICADFLCVNPYSDNKEIALAYIEALSAPETERETLDYFISDMMLMQQGEQDDHDHDHDHDAEPNVVYDETSLSVTQSILENPPFLPLYDTEELHGIANYDLYKQLLARSTKEHKRTELGSYFSELLEKLCAGTIDEKTAAEGLYKKMRMVRDE